MITTRVLLFSVSALLGAVLALPISADSNGEQNVDSVIALHDYFIVTRMDERRCAAPECGGYFVKRVNTDVARCADGTWQAECHSFRIQFPGGPLPPDEPVIRTLEDGQSVDLREALSRHGRVIMRGELRKAPVEKGVSANVLVTSEMWLGRHGFEPSGHFSRLDPLMIACITHPCAQYVERSLNTNLVDFLAGVSYAPPAAPFVGSGEFPLIRGSVLAVGAHSTVTGPGGTMNLFRAREIYDPLFFIMDNESVGAAKALRSPHSNTF